MSERLGGFDKDEINEDEYEEPQSCPCCNAHPAFDEIAENRWECRNCGAIIGKKDGEWIIFEEGEEPMPDTEDDLWDEVDFDGEKGEW